METIDPIDLVVNLSEWEDCAQWQIIIILKIFLARAG